MIFDLFRRASAGLASLALHVLILGLAFAAGNHQPPLPICETASVSIVYLEAPGGYSVPALNSFCSPVQPPVENSFSIPDRVSDSKNVILKKAVTSGKRSIAKKYLEHENSRQEIALPESAPSLGDLDKPVDGVPVSRPEAQEAGSAAASPAVETPSSHVQNVAGSQDYLSGHQETGTGKDMQACARPNYGANTPPSYPTVARKRGYEGLTRLRVEVLETGNVGGIEIAASSGFDLLDEAAAHSVKNWRFAPGTKNGKRVRQWVVVPIRFSLREGNK